MPRFNTSISERYIQSQFDRTGFRSDYPELTCYWRLEVDGKRLSANEISGLNEKLEYVTYRDGSNKDGVATKRLAKPSGGRITIKWAIFSEDNHGAQMFHNWRDDRTTHPDKDVRVDILITLLDQNEFPVIWWNCRNCTPLEYQGPTLKADVSEIAMQTLILEVEQIQSKTYYYPRDIKPNANGKKDGST